MYSQRNMRGELVTAIVGIALTLVSALVTASVKYAKEAYSRHQEQKIIEMQHRDIAVHNRIMYRTRIILNGSLQDLQLEPRARHEVPNFIEDSIEYGDQIRIKYIVYVRTTILNDEGIYERVEKDVPGECNAPSRDSILFTISQSASTANNFSFICTASEYR